MVATAPCVQPLAVQVQAFANDDTYRPLGDNASVLFRQVARPNRITRGRGGRSLAKLGCALHTAGIQVRAVNRSFAPRSSAENRFDVRNIVAACKEPMF
jgi:hypothetical protein